MEIQERVIELEKQLIEKEAELNRVTSRALRVHERNNQLTASPEMLSKMAEMDYQLKLAEKFIKSGAFPRMAPEQAFVIMRAGKEMGMSEIEALSSLYVVNGKIDIYGKAMVAKLTNNGYSISYEKETPSEVTVVAKKDGVVISERVTKDDQIIEKSKAAGFALKNKMRFHGIRMILNFHLAHLIQSAPDLFDVQYHQYEQVKEEEQIGKLDKIFEEE